MAKPPIRKPKKKQNPLTAAKIDVHRLQGHRAVAQVHLRPRQDPRASRHRRQLAAAARDREGDQERPRDGVAALHLDGTIGDATHEADPHSRGGGAGPRRRHRRSSRWLRAKLPRAAWRGDQLDEGRRAPDRARSGAPATHARSATWAMPARSRPTLEKLNVTLGAGPARAASCSARSLPTTLRRPSSRPGAR